MTDEGVVSGPVAEAAAPDLTGASTRWPVVLAVTIVLLVGGAAAWGNRGQLNPDGICYLHLASYLAHGDVAASISAYWNPLLVWLLTPLLSLGLERLVAARLVLLLCAAGGVVAADRLARHLGLEPLPRAAALATIALALAELATRVITPDILVGACLLAYAASVTHPRLLRCRRRAAMTGLVAGVCFLAKSFALPFVLLHLPFMVGLRALMGTDLEVRRRDVAQTLAVAMGALAVIALSWIGVLSVRFQRLTWGTSGANNHASVGPGAPPGAFRLPHGLQVPPPPHRSMWETPELLGYPAWSPLASPENRAHQINIITRNSASALRILQAWDWLGLTLPALGLAPFLAWRARRHLARAAPAVVHWSVWVPATFALYVGGYLPILVEDRFLLAFLLPLVVLLLVAWALRAGAWFEARSRSGAARPGRVLSLTLVGLTCACFAVGPLRTLVERARRGDSGSESQVMVRALREARVRGPLAVVVDQGQSDLSWHLGQYVAFYLDETYVGTPSLAQAQTPGFLDAYGVASVLVTHATRTRVDLGGGWERRCVLGDPDGSRTEVFVRADRDRAEAQDEPQHDGGD